MRKCSLIKNTIIQTTRTMKSTGKNPMKEVFKSIMEGRAILQLTSDKVFYNPVQEFNRDLSIAVLNVFVQDFKKQKLLEAEKRGGSIDNENSMEDDKKVEITILEALSATGLRSIRYAKEVVDATKIVANDISEQAVQTIRDNINFNNVDHIAETSHEDACLLMYKHKHRKKRFSAIDLDPYGTPAMFLDAAVQSVADGGLLLVTATDMAVLAGNSPETCYSKYGAISLKTKCCHELALRILLQCIEAHANRYSRYIEPLLSVSADFYIRVFVKIHSGAAACKKTTSKLSMVYQCVGCDTMTLQPLGAFRPNPTPQRPDQVQGCLPSVPPVSPLCDNCNQKHHLGGPIWSAPIHDESFVARVLHLVQESRSTFGTARRLEGVLSVVREELMDAPLYYTVDRLCGTLHTEMLPILLFRSAILNAGYKVSYSHANKLSIKTEAPSRLIWDIMRTWATRQPIKPEKIEANPIIKHIISQPITYKVDLTERSDANPESRKERQTRFQFNPTPHWGPGSRSSINDAQNKMLKSIKNQNKGQFRRRYFHKRPRFPAGIESGYKRHRQFLIDNSDRDAEGEAEVADVKEVPKDEQADASMLPSDPTTENGVKPPTANETSEISTDTTQ